MERIIPRLNNAFDYVVQHGEALEKNRRAFDSCQREAIADGHFELTDYSAVIWAAGRQTNVFDATEKRLLGEYLDAGGNIFISGAYVAEGLSKSHSEGPHGLGVFECTECTSNLTNYSADAQADSIFKRNESLKFGEGHDQSYFLPTVNTLVTPNRVKAALLYGNSAGTAAVQYQDSTGGKVVCFGFPFETISSKENRNEYLADILRFFDLKRHPGAITPRLASTEEGTELIWISTPGRKYQVQASTGKGSAVWKNVGEPVSATGLTTHYTGSLTGEPLQYRVILLN